MAISDYEDEIMRRDTERMLMDSADREYRSLDPDFYPCPDCKRCLCCDCICEGGPAQRMDEAWKAYDLDQEEATQ